MKILVLEAVGLHLGYLGCYGNDWVATPNLDRLASEGVVFDQHILDRPIFVGADPSQRSVGTGRFVGSDPHPLFASESVDRFGDLASTTQRIEVWLREESPLLWLEGPSLLPPWKLPRDLLEVYWDEDEEEDPDPWTDPPMGPADLELEELFRLQNTYAAVVTDWDARLGKLLDDLRAKGHLDQIALGVTACSGFPLAEHGKIGLAASALHDELIHVPLVWRLPGCEFAGLRIPALTQPVDLLPTFADWLGIDLKAGQGKSLVPLLRGEVDAIRPYACSTQQLGDEEEWLLRTPDWAYQRASSGVTRLFVKPDDRWEVNDLAARQPELVEHFERILQRYRAAILQPGSLEYPELENSPISSADRPVE